MKIVELINNVRVPITNEEYDVLSLFREHDELHRQDFNERQIIVANSLVNKDVLYRKNQNGRITYHKKTT